MSLIEGIGDEVTHFFIALFAVIVVIGAWWTTGITEQRYVQTVWLLDRRNRRRHRLSRRLTNHTHTITVSEGTSSTSAALPISNNNPDEVATPMSSTTNKPPEEAGASSSEQANPVEERSEEDEEQIRIVETMDADTCELRQRRLAFYNRNSNTESVIKPQTENRENQNEETTNSNIMEHNYAERNSELPSETNNSASTEIKIKLKYINDDLKLVNGKLTEQLGEFKRRHFEAELSSNKIVRLIFNGQVLQQDSKTLQGCGLFDNCVVHCLIHQKRTQTGQESSSQENINENIGFTSNNNTNNNNNINNNQGREWDLGNFLFAIISFTLLSAWYFRYVYAHLYTVTATIGLVLMTGVFSIILFGAYFPDPDRVPQFRNHNNNL